MKRYAAKILFAVTATIIFGAGTTFHSQPSPRPLPPEFFKRRDAATAFALGRQFLRQGQRTKIQASIAKFREAGSIYREIGDRTGAACALLGTGAAYAALGDGRAAARSYLEASSTLDSFRAKDVDESTLVKLGFLYDHLVGKRFLFKYDGLSIARPKRGYDRNGDRIDTRFSQLSEHETVQFLNQPIVVYIEPERESIFDDPRFAGSGDPPKPVSFYKDALSVWKRSGFESIEVATGLSLMDAWAGRDDRVAVFYGKQAINRYQEIRRLLRTERPYDRRVYINQLTEKYRILADLLIGLGRLTEAEDVLQMLKDEEFSEFVRRDAVEIERLKQRVRLTPKERDLIDRYLAIAGQAAEIGEQQRKLEEKRRKAAAIGGVLSAEDQRSLADLNARSDDINSTFRLFLEKELVMEIGTENAKSLAADRSLQDRVREWGSGTAVLTTVITENRYRVILTTAAIQIDAKTDINAAELNKKIFEFRNALQDPDIDPRPIGKELYDILIKPIEKQLADSHATTLVWSLDGTLRYIPFAALSPDGESYLVERFRNVIMTPKTRERVKGDRSPWRAVGAGVSEEQLIAVPGNPGQKIRIEAIPATRTELMSIIRDETEPTGQGIFDGRRFLDSAFTLDNFTASLASKDTNGRSTYNVLHVASHFQLSENWSNSFLLLGGGKTLTLEQLSNMRDLDLSGIELATLSACNTALVTSASGYEVDSLAESIQSKGGKAVLATLWSVNDASTAKLMSSFYGFKKKDPTMTKADALQRAQLEMLREAPLSHPFFWSGFTLIGNWL
ncbi:MAG: CHAT domain-containing protein [Acidobacteria bacterium]|nr:CHAT domain-containing protein [Acidobacteriota bacterium]